MNSLRTIDLILTREVIQSKWKSCGGRAGGPDENCAGNAVRRYGEFSTPSPGRCDCSVGRLALDPKEKDQLVLPPPRSGGNVLVLEASPARETEALRGSAESVGLRA